MPSSAFPTVLDTTNAGSTETSTDLLNDRINLVAATTLLGVTYGIMTTLYCMTTYSLLKKLFRRTTRSGSSSRSLSRSKMEWRRTLFYLAYTSILFVLATLYTAGNSQNAIIAYVDNRLYPGGPAQYYVTYMVGQPVMIMTDVTSTMILWMTDALILCRFIMFYYKVSYVKWIIPLPCVMFVGVAVLSALVLQGEASLGKIFYLSENMILTYYVLSFSLNVLATVLIAARLYWHKVQLERVFGPRTGSSYMSIATLLIESAALYGTWSIVFLILCILRSPGQTLILGTMSHIQVIAPLLIILWTARGKAWKGATHYSEDTDADADEPDAVSSRRTGIGIGFGARPTRVGGAGVDADADASRNASWSTVVGDAGVHEVAMRKHGNVNVIELGVCSSVVVHDPKA